MGAGKKAPQIVENVVTLRCWRHKKEVRAGRYYTIYDFCRTSGCNGEMSDEICKWCRTKEAIGQTRTVGELEVSVREGTDE